MASRKYPPGSRVWLPDGQRGTVVPWKMDSGAVSVLEDRGRVESFPARHLAPLSLLDRMAEEANAVETNHKIGDEVVLSMKRRGLVKARVVLVTIHGEVVLLGGDQDDTIIVATPRVQSKHARSVGNDRSKTRRKVSRRPRKTSRNH